MLARMKPSTLLSRSCSAVVFGFGAATGFGASGFFLAAGLPFDAFLAEFLDEFLDADLPLDVPGFFDAPAFLAATVRLPEFLAVRLLADFARG
jgi:hypothetical protein